MPGEKDKSSSVDTFPFHAAALSAEVRIESLALCVVMLYANLSL